jgi:serine phosphatase RsbU (regulator of sigma subunit)
MILSGMMIAFWIKKGMFVTMFCGLLDNFSGEFVFASAGHNPLIKVTGQSGTVEQFKTKGYPLGMMPPEQFDKRLEIGKLQLQENDWLIQFTDGVNEAQNSSGEQFGMKRLLKLIENSCQEPPENMVAKVQKEVEEFTGVSEQFDDITFLVMKKDKLKVDIDNNNNIMRIAHAD